MKVYIRTTKPILKYRFQLYGNSILLKKTGKGGYARIHLNNPGQSLAKRDKAMDFKEFIHRLASVISAGGSTAEFTRSIFEAILSDDGQVILDEYQPSTYKSFYNGQAKISRLAKKINTYIEPIAFSEYIHQFPDGAVENLCRQFSDILPHIDLHNAGDMLADLFNSIIIEAAGASKKDPSKNASKKGGSSAIIRKQD